MYAIIETGGKQFTVRRDGKIRVPSLRGEVGDRVTFDRVLYTSDGDRISVGNPVVEGARVVGEIVRHGRGKKIVVFKYKRRHRYRRKLGHRQDFTEVAITAVELQDGAREGRDEHGRGKTKGQRAEAAAATEQPTQERSAKGRADAGVTDAAVHVCEECGRGFASERGLQQHRSKAHG